MSEYGLRELAAYHAVRDMKLFKKNSRTFEEWAEQWTGDPGFIQRDVWNDLKPLKAE